MNTIEWLFIGHFIGDWLLQNDWMARGKKQGLFTVAGMTHFTIYTVVLMLALWLSQTITGSQALYLSIAMIIFLTHWMIDATSLVKWWISFYRQSDILLMHLMVDQIFHGLVIVGVALFLDFDGK